MTLRHAVSLAALALALTAAPAIAAPKADPAKTVGKLVASPAFKTAVAKLDADYDRTVADIITLTEIPAPPFKEEKRAKAYLEMLKAHGLTHVEKERGGHWTPRATSWACVRERRPRAQARSWSSPRTWTPSSPRART